MGSVNSLPREGDCCQFYGRVGEIERIEFFLNDDKKRCLAITGIMQSGKSELILHCLRKKLPNDFKLCYKNFSGNNAKCFDIWKNEFYVNFKRDTVDLAVCKGMEHFRNEFISHFNLSQTKTIVVFDNIDSLLPDFQEEVQSFLNNVLNHCNDTKLIFTSRYRLKFGSKSSVYEEMIVRELLIKDAIDILKEIVGNHYDATYMPYIAKLCGLLPGPIITAGCLLNEDDGSIRPGELVELLVSYRLYALSPDNYPAEERLSNFDSMFSSVENARQFQDCLSNLVWAVPGEEFSEEEALTASGKIDTDTPARIKFRIVKPLKDRGILQQAEGHKIRLHNVLRECLVAKEVSKDIQSKADHDGSKIKTLDELILSVGIQNATAAGIEISEDDLKDPKRLEKRVQEIGQQKQNTHCNNDGDESCPTYTSENNQPYAPKHEVRYTQNDDGNGLNMLKGSHGPDVQGPPPSYESAVREYPGGGQLFGTTVNQESPNVYQSLQASPVYKYYSTHAIDESQHQRSNFSSDVSIFPDSSNHLVDKSQEIQDMTITSTTSITPLAVKAQDNDIYSTCGPNGNVFFNDRICECNSCTLHAGNEQLQRACRKDQHVFQQQSNRFSGGQSEQTDMSLTKRKTLLPPKISHENDQGTSDKAISPKVTTSPWQHFQPESARNYTNTVQHSLPYQQSSSDSFLSLHTNSYRCNGGLSESSFGNIPSEGSQCGGSRMTEELSMLESEVGSSGGVPHNQHFESRALWNMHPESQRSSFMSGESPSPATVHVLQSPNNRAPYEISSSFELLSDHQSTSSESVRVIQSIESRSNEDPHTRRNMAVGQQQLPLNHRQMVTQSVPHTSQSNEQWNAHPEMFIDANKIQRTPKQSAIAESGSLGALELVASSSTSSQVEQRSDVQVSHKHYSNDEYENAGNSHKRDACYARREMKDDIENIDARTHRTETSDSNNCRSFLNSIL